MSKKNPLSLQPDVEQVMAGAYAPQADDFEPAGESEKENYIHLRKSTSYWADAWRRLRRNKVAMTALAVLIFVILFAAVGPLIVPYSYEEQLRGSEDLAPFTYSPSEIERMENGESVFPHLFGTDKFGRDLMVRVMYGTRVSMTIGVVASLIVLVIGTIYGAIAGYFGGKVDFVMMRVVDAIYSLPDILVILLLKTILNDPLRDWINNSNNPLVQSFSQLGVGVISIFIVFGLLYWVGMARIIRGQVLTLKQQEYVTAARALGASPTRIIRKHLLPNCVGQIIVTTMMQIPSAIFTESFLSFLGMGVSAPMASLGSLASDALGGIYTYASRLIIPSIALSLIILTFNLFGDGLRDALDPRMKK
jgi:oligopeptide transport system permease protein